MNYFCFVVYNFEIYDGVCEDVWFRIIIIVEENFKFIFFEDSFECSLMVGIMMCNDVLVCLVYWRMM